MNFILHNKGTGEVHSDNTLSSPYYTDDFGELRKFDFIVMNPPFSDKDWSDGIKADEDTYHRFDGYGIPPEKNGDYAWFLHVLKALNENGKAGIILPHGVLFRGNAEETIRKEILKRKYIKGIVGLPSNLFYGTGIPACIIIIDKENADKREGLFMIDASDGFKKDGDKNRLREQDIEKIVQVFTNKTEIKGYSRFIAYNEIIEDNNANLNVPRYISKINKNLPQNINSHLNGGIPEKDIDSMERLWNISSELRNKIFEKRNNANVYDLKVEPESIEDLIFEDEKIKKVIQEETIDIFNTWKQQSESVLKNIDSTIIPKNLIRELGFSILKAYEKSKLLDNYDAYDFLLNYWNEKMQDDVYLIKASGYEAGAEIDRKYGKKKIKDEQGIEIEIEDKKKFKSFDGLLIPKEIIEKEYFNDELEEISTINSTISEIDEKMNEIFEENSGEDGLINDAINDKGNITKKSLSDRIKKIDKIKDKEEYELLISYQNLLKKKDSQNKELKSKTKSLDERIEEQYSKLTEKEIKDLLVDKKWMARINNDIKDAVDSEINNIAAKLVEISKRYETTLSQLEEKAENSRNDVRNALERMGYSW